jgi:hypothetical protein
MVERVWEDVDKLNLFTWLDFCLRNDLNFEETISQHLAESRNYRPSDAVTFTWKQVKQKIGGQARTYAQYKRKHALSLQDILETGSSAIIGMPQDLRRDIARTVSQYAVLHAQLLSQNHSNGSTSKAQPTPPKGKASAHQRLENAENELVNIANAKVGLHNYDFSSMTVDISLGAGR